VQAGPDVVEQEEQLNEFLKVASAEGNNDKMTTLVNAAAAELNIESEAARRRRRLSADRDVTSPDACTFADEQHLAQARLREGMVASLFGARTSQSSSVESIKSASAAVGALVAEPCELSEAAQEAALGMFESLVRSSRGGLGDGTGEQLINGLGNLLLANHFEAQQAAAASSDASSGDGGDDTDSPNSAGRRRLQAANENGSGDDQSSGSLVFSPSEDSSGSGADPERQALSAASTRADKLREVVDSATALVLQSLVPGEEALRLGDGQLTVTLQVVESASDLEGAEFSGVALPGSLSASFSLGSGTLSTAQAVSAKLATFAVNPYAAAHALLFGGSANLTTAVTSIVIGEGDGTEIAISDAISPIQINIPIVLSTDLIEAPDAENDPGLVQYPDWRWRCSLPPPSSPQSVNTSQYSEYPELSAPPTSPRTPLQGPLPPGSRFSPALPAPSFPSAPLAPFETGPHVLDPGACELVFKEGDCAEFNGCSGHGVCLDSGLCQCDAGFFENDCSKRVSCQFWTSDGWSDEGCVAAPSPPAARSVLHCECSHLTDFGGITIPLSVEDLRAEIKAFNFNLLTADDIAGFFTSFNDTKNVVIIQVVSVIVVLNILTYLFAYFRLHRRIVKLARADFEQRRKRRIGFKKRLQKAAAASKNAAMKTGGDPTDKYRLPRTLSSKLKLPWQDMKRSSRNSTGSSEKDDVEWAAPVGLGRARFGALLAPVFGSKLHKRGQKQPEQTTAGVSGWPVDSQAKDGQADEQHGKPCRSLCNTSRGASVAPQMSSRTTSGCLQTRVPMIEDAESPAAPTPADAACESRLLRLSPNVFAGVRSDAFAAPQMNRRRSEPGVPSHDPVDCYAKYPDYTAKHQEGNRNFQECPSDTSQASSPFRRLSLPPVLDGNEMTFTQPRDPFAAINHRATASTGEGANVSPSPWRARDASPLPGYPRRNSINSLRMSQRLRESVSSELGGDAGEDGADPALEAPRLLMMPSSSRASLDGIRLSHPDSRRPSRPATPTRRDFVHAALSLEVEGSSRSSDGDVLDRTASPRAAASLISQSTSTWSTCVKGTDAESCKPRVCQANQHSPSEGADDSSNDLSSHGAAMWPPAYLRSPTGAASRSRRPSANFSRIRINPYEAETNDLPGDSASPSSPLPLAPLPPPYVRAPLGPSAVVAAKGAVEEAAPPFPPADAPREGAGSKVQERIAAAPAPSLKDRLRASIATVSTPEQPNAALGARSRRNSNAATNMLVRRVSEELVAMKRRAASSEAAIEGRALIKEGDVLGFAALSLRLFRQRCRFYVRKLVSTAREEHTIVSFIAPHFSIDPKSLLLSDTQISQIFWNCVVLEMVMLSLLYSPPQPGASTKFSPFALILKACIVGGPCAASAVVFRWLFRWGNRGRRHLQKKQPEDHFFIRMHQAPTVQRRESQPKMEKSASRISRELVAERALDKKLALAKRKKVLLGRLQYYTAWLLVLVVYLICIIFLLVLTSVKIGVDDTQSFLLSWYAAMMMAWVVMEPIEVGALVFFPFIFENKCIANLRQFAKDLNLY